MSLKFKNRDDLNAATLLVLTNNDNHNHPQEDISIADAEAVNMMRNAIVQQHTVVHLHQHARIHGTAAPSLLIFTVSDHRCTGVPAYLHPPPPLPPPVKKRWTITIKN